MNLSNCFYNVRLARPTGLEPVLSGFRGNLRDCFIETYSTDYPTKTSHLSQSLSQIGRGAQRYKPVNSRTIKIRYTLRPVPERIQQRLFCWATIRKAAQVKLTIKPRGKQ